MNEFFILLLVRLFWKNQFEVCQNVRKFPNYILVLFRTLTPLVLFYSIPQPLKEFSQIYTDMSLYLERSSNKKIIM